MPPCINIGNYITRPECDIVAETGALAVDGLSPDVIEGVGS